MEFIEGRRHMNIEMGSMVLRNLPYFVCEFRIIESILVFYIQFILFQLGVNYLELSNFIWVIFS